MKKSKKKAAKKPLKKANAKIARMVKAKPARAAKAKKKPAKKVTHPTVAQKPVKKTPEKKIIGMFLKEMEQEARTTRKFLERIPEDKYSWQPHPKSMTLQRLATHVAELPSWATMAINTDELNFAANDYVPHLAKNNAELLSTLEKSLEGARKTLEKSNDDVLQRNWVMRNGNTIISKSTKGDVIRMAYSQIIHHRAQLGVFLRLLEVPIPGSYGPSADEQNFS